MANAKIVEKSLPPQDGKRQSYFEVHVQDGVRYLQGRLVGETFSTRELAMSHVQQEGYTLRS